MAERIRGKSYCHIIDPNIMPQKIQNRTNAMHLATGRSWSNAAACMAQYQIKPSFLCFFGKWSSFKQVEVGS